MGVIEQDLHWMRLALQQAHSAAELGEVPVGAVLIRDNQLLSSAHNAPISLSDPSAHAEIRVIRAAASHIDNYRLNHTTLYVTLEPCMMCLGAIVHARISRLVFAATEPKAGCICSRQRPKDLPWLNHQFQWSGGILAAESKQLLQHFFKQRRKQQKEKRS